MPSAKTTRLCILGVIGAVLHLLLGRGIAHWMYAAPADRSFIDHPLTSIVLALLGGFFYALLLSKLNPQRNGHDASRFLVALVKGGLLGMTATAAALQALYLLSAFYLAIKGAATIPESHVWANFLIFIIPIESYGLIAIYYLLVPSFASGALAVAAMGVFDRSRAAP